MVRSVLLTSFAVAVTGCSASTELSDIVVVEIAVGAPTVSLGALVAILVTITNRGIEPVEVDMNTCPENFEVFGIDGEQVGPPTPTCPLVFLPPQTLQPGKSLEFDHAWDGTGNAGGIGQRVALPLGTYRLRGRAFVVGHGLAFSELTPIEVVGVITR